MTPKPAFLAVARPVLCRWLSTFAAHARCRLAVTALLLSLPCACVIPLAPDFQDPPAAQNFAPVITDSFPDNGAVVTATMVPTMFRVTVSDPNLNDDLHVRWIADYPPFSANSRRLLDRDIPPSNAATPQSTDVSITIDCLTSTLALGLTQHQIMVFIADRDFLPGDNQPLDRKLTALPDTAGHAEAHWILNLECK
jgi:hypothetical protein